MRKYNYGVIKDIIESEYFNYLTIYSSTSMAYDQNKKIPETYRKYLNPKHASQLLCDNIKIRIEDYVNDSSKFIYVIIYNGNIYVFLNFLLFEYNLEIHKLFYLIPIYHPISVYDNAKNLMSSVNMGIFIEYEPLTKEVYHNGVKARIKENAKEDFYKLVDQYYNIKMEW